MRFANPFWLLALIFILGYWFYQQKNKSISTIKFPNVKLLKQLQNNRSKFLARLAKYIRFVLLILIVLVLARPQIVEVKKEIKSEGIDIMLVMDTSQSMAAEDLTPNRLSVAKKTVQDFISKREHDQIGLVVFGAEAFTQCPLTIDYNILINLLSDVKISMVGDGTAIGTSILTALNRLKDSKATSRIIILLTDGENNQGEVSPEKAAQFAKNLGIKIYTIGVGQEGGAPIPFMHPLYGKIYSDTNTYLDEDTLNYIAKTTNGNFFRAKDAEALSNIYDKINELEKSEIRTNQYAEYQDLFIYGLYIILTLFLIELLVYNVLFVVAP
ncbi:MAG: aerotolerance regulator BatA [Rickettsiales bacterium]|nr:aerotolerance regulator BatA [Rickettsiales bacterium]|tara:strand:+ start:1320 stop:2300 length:981 start_codon:yes stop_codon:yes gene_type:complete